MYICIEKKKTVYIGSGTIRCFRHPLGTLECIHGGKGGAIIMGILQRGTQVERPEKDESVLSMNKWFKASDEEQLACKFPEII